MATTVTVAVVGVGAWSLVLLLSLVPQRRCKTFRRGMVWSAVVMVAVALPLTTLLATLTVVESDFCSQPEASAMALLPTKDGFGGWSFVSNNVLPEAGAGADEGAGRRLHVTHMSLQTVELVRATAQFYFTCDPLVQPTNISTSGGPDSALSKVRVQYRRLQELQPVMKELQAAADVLGLEDPELWAIMANVTRVGAHPSTTRAARVLTVVSMRVQAYNTFNSSIAAVIGIMQCRTLHHDYVSAVQGVCCDGYEGVTNAMLGFAGVDAVLLVVLACGLWLAYVTRPAADGGRAGVSTSSGSPVASSVSAKSQGTPSPPHAPRKLGVGGRLASSLPRLVRRALRWRPELTHGRRHSQRLASVVVDTTERGMQARYHRLADHEDDSKAASHTGPAPSGKQLFTKSGARLRGDTHESCVSSVQLEDLIDREADRLQLEAAVSVACGDACGDCKAGAVPNRTRPGVPAPQSRRQIAIDGGRSGSVVSGDDLQGAEKKRRQSHG